jgi:hypothetical protein
MTSDLPKPVVDVATNLVEPCTASRSPNLFLRLFDASELHHRQTTRLD